MNTPGSILKTLRQALALAWTASPSLMVRYFLLSMLGAAFPPLVLWLSSHLVDILAQPSSGTGWAYIVPTIVGLWVTASGQRAVNAYAGYGRSLFVRKVQLEAEKRLLVKAATADVGHFDDPAWHDRLARAKRDVASRPGDLTWSLLTLSSNAVTVTMMAALLASLHYALVLLALAGPLLSVYLERRAAAHLSAFQFKEAPEERERLYLADLLVQPKVSNEIRAHLLSDHLLNMHHRKSDEMFRLREAAHRTGARSLMLTGIATGTCLALAYLFVSAQTLSGVLDPGGIVLLVGAFTAVSQALVLVSSALVSVEQHAVFLEDYFSFLTSAPLVLTPSAPQKLSLQNGLGIEFENVTFAYPGRSRPALARFNLHIHPGELVAIVGENGAGKSTFVRLLLRFYDTDQGAIRIGGVNVRQMDPRELRSHFGVLFQDFANYEMTLRDAVAIGRPGVPRDDARVLRALTHSNSAAIFSKLAAGLDSRVGRLFEGGHELSGGEWQRLALARTIYRDAGIWILDEPTASLDPEAEIELFAALRQLLQGRIAIVISHRFSTVRRADKIVVMRDGAVAETGSHADLIDADGHYARLFELQAAGYK